MATGRSEGSCGCDRSSVGRGGSCAASASRTAAPAARTPASALSASCARHQPPSLVPGKDSRHGTGVHES